MKGNLENQKERKNGIGDGFGGFGFSVEGVTDSVCVFSHSREIDRQIDRERERER